MTVKSNICVTKSVQFFVNAEDYFVHATATNDSSFFWGGIGKGIVSRDFRVTQSISMDRALYPSLNYGFFLIFFKCHFHIKLQYNQP